ncbi:MAG: hypothetical protein J7L39_02065 [Candidatus Aenigmarchaeota archaeon]|nr:hypothetical protein [Candidatus Aenigmarchaeota archaeon]
MKGISPLVSAVLLIAIAVAIGSLFGAWIISFSRTQISILKKQTTSQVDCSNANIAFSGELSYCFGYFSSNIVNSGLIKLENISLNVVYANGSIDKVELCKVGVEIHECTNSNISLIQGEEIFINISLDQNFNSISVISDTCPGVKDTIYSEDVSFC